MRKIIYFQIPIPRRWTFLLAIVLLTVQSLSAQVYLTDEYKPAEERYYTAYPSWGEEMVYLSAFDYAGGFTLGSGFDDRFGLTITGYAEFLLPDGYDRLSFVIGPYDPQSTVDGSNAIIVVRADDRKVYDRIVWCHDAPREVVLPVKGAHRLRFDVVSGRAPVAFGSVRLWQVGQTYAPTPNPQQDIFASDTVQLVKQMFPYYVHHTDWVTVVTDRDDGPNCYRTDEVAIDTVRYHDGLQLYAERVIAGDREAGAYFWLHKKYDEVVFTVGPLNGQPYNAAGWFTVKGDEVILYEKRITPETVPERVVVRTKQINQLSFCCSGDNSPSNEGIYLGVVDMTARVVKEKTVRRGTRYVPRRRPSAHR